MLEKHEPWTITSVTSVTSELVLLVQCTDPVQYNRKRPIYPFASWPLVMLGQVCHPPSPPMPWENIRPISKLTSLRWYKFSEVQFKISISHSFQRFFSKLGLFYMQWEMAGGEKGMYSLCFPLLPPLLCGFLEASFFAYQQQKTLDSGFLSWGAESNPAGHSSLP